MPHFLTKKQSSCTILLSLQRHSDKKLQYLSNQNWWSASKMCLQKSASDIKTFMSQQKGKLFFSSEKKQNTKISPALPTPVLCWLPHYIFFPEIAPRFWAFLAYRDPCAGSREGYSVGQRLAVVEWTWGQWECPILLPKGHRVQQCQHPGSHHYRKCLPAYRCITAAALGPGQPATRAEPLKK